MGSTECCLQSCCAAVLFVFLVLFCQPQDLPPFFQFLHYSLCFPGVYFDAAVASYIYFFLFVMLKCLCWRQFRGLFVSSTNTSISNFRILLFVVLTLFEKTGDVFKDKSITVDVMCTNTSKDKLLQGQVKIKDFGSCVTLSSLS